MLGFMPLASAPLASLDVPYSSGSSDISFSSQGTLVVSGSLAAGNISFTGQGTAIKLARPTANETFSFSGSGTLLSNGKLVSGPAGIYFHLGLTGKPKAVITSSLSTLSFTQSLSLRKKNALYGSTGVGFGTTGSVSQGMSIKASTSMGISGTLDLGFKSGIVGSAGLSFSSTSSAVLTTSGSTSFGLLGSGTLFGALSVVAAPTEIKFIPTSRLMSRMGIDGAISMAFAIVTPSLDKFSFDTVLQGLDPVTDANPKIHLYIPQTPYTFFLLQTFNKIDKVENAYAAILNKTTGDWDRALILVGNSNDYSHAVDFRGGYDNTDFFGSVQTSNVRSIPQQAKNHTFTFKIENKRLKFTRHTKFEQVYEIPSEYWKTPAPFIMDLHGEKFAIHMSKKTNYFEFFNFDGHWRQYTPLFDNEPMNVSTISRAGYNFITEQLELTLNANTKYKSVDGFNWELI